MSTLEMWVAVGVLIGVFVAMLAVLVRMSLQDRHDRRRKREEELLDDPRLYP